MKRVIIVISAIILVAVVYFLVFKPSQKSETYVVVEPLTDRLGFGYKTLHEIILPNERLGQHINTVTSDLYNKNEGWLLRNKTVYCSNRLIDDIEQISADSGIDKYTGNPDGNQLTMDIEAFKKNLVSLNELCVSETEFQGEKALEATLFINPEHLIWKKVD